MSDTDPSAAATKPVGRRRSRRLLLLASGLVVALAVGVIGATPPQSADAAIAGTTRLLDVPQQSLTSSHRACDLAQYCVSYSLKLTDKSIFQVQLNNPTAQLEIALRDDFGNMAAEMRVYANESNWMNVGVRSDGSSGLGVSPVVRPGNYRLDVASDSQLFFGLLAFSIPDSLKVVGTSSTTAGEFNDRSTRRISGKYTQYTDGVAFNAKAGARVTITFAKPGEKNADLSLYDSYRNEVASSGSSSGDTAQILSYVVPYSGLYQVFAEGSSQGKFTLKVSQYVGVTKVSLNKKSVTLKLNKKSRMSVVLKATVAPSNASVKKVTWASSNTKVAKVNKKGKVTAVRAGKAVITATTQDGAKRAKVKIVVKKR